MLQKFLNQIETIKKSHFYLILVLLAMVLATRVQYIQHGWINPDTVLYFESARLIALGQFKEAVGIFNWPMYSLCIAAAHKITTLNIHHSAQLLTVLFFAITTFSFTKIIELGGGNHKSMFAGALILFSSLYIVGDVLEMLMRDQGFWACFLTSLVFFIRFKTKHQYRDAFFWQVFAVLATLFRIEAIMYLLFLPLALLFEKDQSWKQRISHLIKCNFLNILVGIAIGLALAFSSQLSMQSFGRLKEVFTSKLFQELTYNLVTRGQIMSEQVLGKYLEEFAIVGLLLTFAYVMIVKAITTTGLVNFVLAAFSNQQKKLIKPATRATIQATAIIAFVTMGLIITKVFVLSSRYVVALAFMLMLMAAFQLGKILTECSQGKTKKGSSKILITLILLFMAGSILKNVWPKADGYNYIKTAAEWAKQHEFEDHKIFFQDVRLRYYSNLTPYTSDYYDWKALQERVLNNSISHFDYLMISINTKFPEQEKWIQTNLVGFEEIKRFPDAKRKKFIVFYQKMKH